MIVLERTHDVSQARVIVSYLRAHGLDAQLLDAATSSVLPAVGGVRIAVPADEERQARRLLQEAEARG